MRERRGDVRSDELLAEVVAEVGVMAVKALRQAARAHDRFTAAVEALTALSGPVPRVLVSGDLVEFDTGRFEVRVADRQQPPRVNGFHLTDGLAPAAPEPWHPESP